MGKWALVAPIIIHYHWHLDDERNDFKKKIKREAIRRRRKKVRESFDLLVDIDARTTSALLRSCYHDSSFAAQSRRTQRVERPLFHSIGFRLAISCRPSSSPKLFQNQKSLFQGRYIGNGGEVVTPRRHRPSTKKKKKKKEPWYWKINTQKKKRNKRKRNEPATRKGKKQKRRRRRRRERKTATRQEEYKEW